MATGTTSEATTAVETNGRNATNETSGQNDQSATALGSTDVIEPGMLWSGNSFSRMNNLLAFTTVAAGLVLAAVVILQAWQGRQTNTENAKILYLLLVGAAGFGLGIFGGFIFGAFGEEKQSFGSITAVLNGIIGGFALSDLTKKESVIKGALQSLAYSCGLQGIGLVGCVITFFGTSGFMFMYMNKQYLLNPLLSKKNRLADQNQKISALTRGVKVSLTEVGNRPSADPKAVEGIKALIKDFETEVQKDPELLALLSNEALKAYSKAYYVVGELGRAESVLRRARSLSPDDPDTLFYLSHLLITAGRPLEAAPYLEFLKASPNAPVLTWKLLGYACLFDANRLGEAESASQKFLALYPNDAGALLNLACVYGQRGPSEPKNIELVLTTLKLASQFDPSTCPFVRAQLMKPGQDFSAWKQVPEFKVFIEAVSDAVPDSAGASQHIDGELPTAGERLNASDSQVVAQSAEH